MSLNGLLHLLLLDPDVPLCHRRAAMLQELLDQRNVIAAVSVDLCRIVLAKAVGADTLDFQIVADELQLLLNRSLCQREDSCIGKNPVIKAIAPDELVQCQRHGKNTGLSRFLLSDRQAVPFAIPDNVRQAQADDIGDPQSKIGLQHQRRRNTLVGAASGEALLHRYDDLFVLLCGQGDRALVQWRLTSFRGSKLRTLKEKITNFRPFLSKSLENTQFLCSYFSSFTN